MTINKVEALLDEFIERDPDAAQRFIEAQLSRILLRKRLEQFKQEKTEQPPENCRQRLQKEGKNYTLARHAMPVAQWHLNGKNVNNV